MRFSRAGWRRCSSSVTGGRIGCPSRETWEVGCHAWLLEGDGRICVLRFGLEHEYWKEGACLAVFMWLIQSQGMVVVEMNMVSDEEALRVRIVSQH